MKDKRSTAYHEAGHAVVQAYFRLKIDRVSIISNADSLGHMKGRIGTDSSIEYEDSGRVQLAVERDAIVFLAGMAAQKEFMPRSVRNHHGRSDYRNAISLLVKLASSEELKLYLKLLEIRARRLVRRPILRVQIEAVAKELLRRKEMNGEQVKKVIRDAMRLYSFSPRSRSGVS